jgi:nuclear-control-of-ATPase protein 2
VVNALTVSLTRYLRRSLIVLGLPFDLARQECRFKRKTLEEIRDNKAEVLGTLSKMRHLLETALGEHPVPGGPDGFNPHIDKLRTIVKRILQLVDEDRVEEPSSPPPRSPGHNIFYIRLLVLAGNILPYHTSLHKYRLRAQHLLRPSRLALLWPRHVLGIPLIIYAIRQAYSSRASMVEVAQESIRTTEGFLRGYLLEPMRDVVKTVRAGGEDGIIVRKEGIAADMDVSFSRGY